MNLNVVERSLFSLNVESMYREDLKTHSWNVDGVVNRAHSGVTLLYKKLRKYPKNLPNTTKLNQRWSVIQNTQVLEPASPFCKVRGAQLAISRHLCHVFFHVQRHPAKCESPPSCSAASRAASASVTDLNGIIALIEH